MPVVFFIKTTDDFTRFDNITYNDEVQYAPEVDSRNLVIRWKFISPGTELMKYKQIKNMLFEPFEDIDKNQQHFGWRLAFYMLVQVYFSTYYVNLLKSTFALFA